MFSHKNNYNYEVSLAINNIPWHFMESASSLLFGWKGDTLNYYRRRGEGDVEGTKYHHRHHVF